MKHCLWLLSLLPSLALASPLGAISDITIQAPDAKVAPECAYFKPSRADVQAFFKRAVLITSRQEHDYFLHGPCTADGTSKTRYEQWEWRMRNMGTAYVVDTLGNAYIFADPKQESSLADD